jgi:hypothetical protein
MKSASSSQQGGNPEQSFTSPIEVGNPYVIMETKGQFCAGRFFATVRLSNQIVWSTGDPEPIYGAIIN